jgi:hypothetical protein
VILSALLVLTGLFSSGEHNGGPFAGLYGLSLGEAHEFLFRILQIAVVLHLAGVGIESIKAKDALVPAMITGVKLRRPDEAGADAQRAKTGVLLVALMAALAVSAWLMSSPPSHLAPAAIEHEIDD